MVQASFSPAVTAGLLDAMTAGLSSDARSALSDAVSAYGLVVASTDFLMGVAAGVSACGVVAIAVAAIASHRAKVRAEEQELAVALGTLESTSSLPTAKDDGQVKVSQANAGVDVPRPSPAEEANQAAGHSKGSVGKRAGSAHMATVEQGRSRRARKASDEVVIPRGVGVGEQETPRPAVKPLAVADDKASKVAARHTATDYGDIAQNYVSRLSWRDRMSIRRRGVQAMLAERLGVDMFEDVPVIQRADGSVGDVGTGWWDAKLGDSVRRDFADLPLVDDIDMTGVRNVLVARSDTASAPVARRVASPAQAGQSQGAATSARLPESVVRSAAEPYVSRVAHLGLSASDRSVFIANHVAFVDDVVFPEVNVGDDDHDDLWALAMDALDARSVDPTVLADMGVEQEDPLHMPDTPTEVLPFRPVAGHPEVVDKATYVDYLLRQELERNSSDAVRRHGRSYLKLIDGGSTSSAPTLFNMRTQRVETVETKPRHMAPGAPDLADLPLAM